MPMTDVLGQMSRTTLLPTESSSAILAGHPPPISDLIVHIVIAAMDADAMTANDRSATWTQRRLSRQLLGLTFLVALLSSQEAPQPPKWAV